MDDRQAGRWYATARVGIGVCLMVAPRALEGWIGPVARQPGAKLLGRILGARDAALGVGTLLALADHTPVRRWLQLAAAVDSVDALVSLGALRHVTARRSLPAAALAAGGAATGAWLATRLP